MKVFEIERIASIGAVERFVINHRDDDPAGYLPREESLVNVISHTGADAVAFANDASDRVLSISNLERFSLFDKHARRNADLSNQQFTFVYLNFKLRSPIVRH